MSKCNFCSQKGNTFEIAVYCSECLKQNIVTKHEFNKRKCKRECKCEYLPKNTCKICQRVTEWLPQILID